MGLQQREDNAGEQQKLVLLQQTPHFVLFFPLSFEGILGVVSFTGGTLQAFCGEKLTPTSSLGPKAQWHGKRMYHTEGVLILEITTGTPYFQERYLEPGVHPVLCISTMCL